MKRLRTLTRKHWLLIVAGIVVVALIAGGSYYAIYQNQKDDAEQDIVRSDACKAEHIKKYVDAAEANDLTALQKVREEVEKLDNYQGSANCQFILVRQSLAAGDADRAERHFDQLRQLAPQNLQLSPQFGDQMVSYEALRNSIETIRMNEDINIEQESVFWGDGL